MLTDNLLQDAVSSNRGKRAICVSLAEAALLKGSCVLLDRCHLDTEQRHDFHH